MRRTFRFGELSRARMRSRSTCVLGSLNRSSVRSDIAASASRQCGHRTTFWVLNALSLLRRLKKQDGVTPSDCRRCLMPELLISREQRFGKDIRT